MEIELTKRQLDILEIVKKEKTITGEKIAKIIGITRSALRTDLQVLTKLGYLDSKTKVGYVISQSLKSYNKDDIGKKIVSDVMSGAVIIDEKESLHSAIIKIFLEDVGSIFVTGEKGLSGVISRKDLVKAMMGGTDLNSVPVSMIMTRMPNIVYISEDTSVSDAVQKLIIHEIDALPVTKTDKDIISVIGRFTKTNATKLFAEIIY